MRIEGSSSFPVPSRRPNTPAPASGRTQSEQPARSRAQASGRTAQARPVTVEGLSFLAAQALASYTEIAGFDTPMPEYTDLLMGVDLYV
ncbi:hypothetical protein LX59_00683 [Azomonas agilis]|uniref:Uncharacterized protein n=1 Tax=Azomonas agilis TaxID=116849 RepID=A0A562J0A8_9GAMM|nr:hypothetical protein [Azomonas agilis]TWH76638.1 hypothetical protein LX59_00683 [Azomonas agilis]